MDSLGGGRSCIANDVSCMNDQQCCDSFCELSAGTMSAGVCKPADTRGVLQPAQQAQQAALSPRAPAEHQSAAHLALAPERITPAKIIS